MSPFNLRKRPRICYYEPEQPNLDEYIFCTECADFVFEYCSIHGPLLVVPDDKVPPKPNVPAIVPRAALTIPHVFLHLARSTIPGAGIGVFTTLALPRGVRFGPYRGLRVDEINSMYCWQIYGKDNRASHAIDAGDPNRSNWMRYVNCSRHWCEQNLIAYQYRGQIYYRTTRIIPRFTELMVFYGSEFANQLGVDLKRYNAPAGFAQKLGTKISNNCKSVRGSGVNLSTVKEHENCVASKTAQNPKDNKDLETTGNRRKANNLQDSKQVDNSKTEDRSSLDMSIVNGKTTIHNVNDNTAMNTANDKSATNIVNSKSVTSIEETATNITDLSKSIVNKNNNMKSDLFNLTCTTSENIKSIDSIVTTDKSVNNSCLLNNTLCSEICTGKKSRENQLKSHLSIQAATRKRSSVSTNIVEKGFSTRIIKRYPCDVCNKAFNQPSNLKTHLRIHTGEKPYTCDVCNKAYNQAGILKRHLRIHTGEKPYTCDVCNKAYNQAGSLKTHLRIHTGEKPYTCDVCNKTFNEPGNLKTHLRIHTGEKPYTCDVCNKAYNRQDNLKRHSRMHTGKKPYTCDVCNKAYNQAGSLKTHLRIHTGEKPYTCDVCNKAFRDKCSLKTHLKIHVGMKAK